MKPKKSLAFGNIFRKHELPPEETAPAKKTPPKALPELAGRFITLKAGDVLPPHAEFPALAWDRVDGQISVRVATIDGIMEGQARIKAHHLKALTPSPIDPEINDGIEYVILLPSVIPQIQDLLGAQTAEANAQPEFETPFTTLARQDGARFGDPEPPEKQKTIAEENEPFFFNGNHGPESEMTPEQLDQPEPEEDPAPITPPIINLRTLRPLPPHSDEEPEPDALNDPPVTPSEMKITEPTSLPPPIKLAGGPLKTFPQVASEQSVHKGAGIIQPPVLLNGNHSSRADQGVELLQEIFMTSESLDATRVAALVQQFPGVAGALILLEGGVVLGGQLPASLNTEAALQAPDLLKPFFDFITQLEPAPQQAKILTVTAANAISLVSSGQIVLLVSHRGRKLPPGLQPRLAETARALDLIYGQADN